MWIPYKSKTRIQSYDQEVEKHGHLHSNYKKKIQKNPRDKGMFINYGKQNKKKKKQQRLITSHYESFKRYPVKKTSKFKIENTNTQWCKHSIRK